MKRERERGFTQSEREKIELWYGLGQWKWDRQMKTIPL